MSTITVHHSTKKVNGHIRLAGSKSISNRVLLIRALCRSKFDIKNLSNSDDTVTMEKLLLSDELRLDAHHAGTTFRFMASYLASSTKHVVTLTGSERMQQRPIKALVDALVAIGADIKYAGQEGYPPLIISPSELNLWLDEVTVAADISSQFISALLMISPTLPKGLKINLIGDIVSKPYIEMTLAMMLYFGVKSRWEDQTILIEHQVYMPKDYYVEGDWSSASYYYSMAALADEAEIRIHGLSEGSLQGDSAVAEIYQTFGVQTTYKNQQIIIQKARAQQVPFLEYNFIKCPDIAQTLAVTVAGMGYTGLYSGLQTLYYKETDRIAALKTELEKVGVFLTKLPKRFTSNNDLEMFTQEGKANVSEEDLIIDTYNDHRMAMSFAPLGLLFPLQISDPMVVSKSYPLFWLDMRELGFSIV